jgi:hypothetical protein
MMASKHMGYRSSLVAVAFAFLASACTHADTSATTSEGSAQPDVALAQNDAAGIARAGNIAIARCDRRDCITWPR